jgi:hypothetical protein
MDTVTTTVANWLRVGDRVNVIGDTNRMRRRVASLDSETQFTMSLYLRPSRGFRKHLRRRKKRAATVNIT